MKKNNKSIDLNNNDNLCDYVSFNDIKSNTLLKHKQYIS